MVKVTRTPLETCRCANALLDEIVHFQKALLERTDPIEMEIPESVPDKGKVSAVCPKGLTPEEFRRALADVFLAASKALARK